MCNNDYCQRLYVPLTSYPSRVSPEFSHVQQTPTNIRENSSPCTLWQIWDRREEFSSCCDRDTGLPTVAGTLQRRLPPLSKWNYMLQDRFYQTLPIYWSQFDPFLFCNRSFPCSMNSLPSPRRKCVQLYLSYEAIGILAL